MSEKKEEKQPVHIGVAGCQRRIGTTTQALQICQYVIRLGKKACYLESNDTDYLSGILALYKNVRKKGTSGAFRWENLLLYSKHTPEKLLEGGFDFLVKDYGSMSERGFDKNGFKEQERKIVVCGAKANEIFFLEEQLPEYRNEKVQYLFSFVPERDRKTIRYMMAEKGRDSYFSDFCPDPTDSSSDSDFLYQAILER